MMFSTNNQKMQNRTTGSSGASPLINCKHAGYCAVILCSDGVIAVGSNKNTSYDMFGSPSLSIIPKSQNVFVNDNFVLVTYGDNYMTYLDGEVFDVNNWIENHIHQYKKPIDLCEDLYLSIKYSKQKLQINLLTGTKDKDSIILANYQISNDGIKIVERFQASRMTKILSNNVNIGFGEFSIISSIISNDVWKQYSVSDILEFIQTKLIKDIKLLDNEVVYNPSGDISIRAIIKS